MVCNILLLFPWQLWWRFSLIWWAITCTKGSVLVYTTGCLSHPSFCLNRQFAVWWTRPRWAGWWGRSGDGNGRKGVTAGQEGVAGECNGRQNKADNRRNIGAGWSFESDFLETETHSEHNTGNIICESCFRCFPTTFPYWHVWPSSSSGETVWMLQPSLTSC